jgi:hypothetical protein
VAFPFTFKVFAKTDVSAQRTVNGVTTTLVQDSDYTVSLNADQEATPGGDVQYTLAVGATLTLLGSLPYDQPTDLPSGGAYRAKVVEDALDRVVIQTQQLAESADRSLRAPVGEVMSTLPNKAARANTIQGYDSDGNPSVAAPLSGTAADVLVQLADASNTARGDAQVAVKTTRAGSVATTQHAWNEAQVLNTAANFGILATGVDQTAAIVALLASLSGYRFRLVIAEGTAFNEQTVRAAIPTGLTVDWFTTVADGSYKQKFIVRFFGDLVADDSQDVVGSSYHPTRALWNDGRGTTDKDDSAARRYMSLAHWFEWTPEFNGPVISFFEQVGKHPTLNVWRKSWRLQTPLVIGMAASHGKWFSGKAAVIGERVYTSTGFVYEALTTTTNGAAEPTGTGASISDGGTTWRYVQPQSACRLRAANTAYGVGAYFLADNYKVYKVTTGGVSSAGAGPTGTGTGIADGTLVVSYVAAALAVDTTRMDLDENGNFGLYGPAGATLISSIMSGAKQFYTSLDATTGDWAIRDQSRGLNVLDGSDAHGARFGVAQGRNWLSISGTGPNAPSTGFAKIANGGATNMSTLVPPAGRVSMFVRMRFDNANTTLIHGTGTNAVRLKGAVNVTPAAGTFVDLEYDSTDTTAWREVGRSF